MAGDLRAGSPARDGRAHGRAVATVVGRGWIPLVVTLVLTYSSALVGSVVAGNVTRALAQLELHLFADAGRDLPVWVGVTAYAQGLVLLGLVVLMSVSALLAGVVEVTRSVRSGEEVPPWTPFRRGLARVPTVARALLVVTPVMALVAVAAVVLLLLSIVTLPLAAVVLVACLIRHTRPRWVGGLVSVAVPFGLIAVTTLRWALWLPFVVVDGDAVRASLRHSRDAVGQHRVESARPLAAVGALFFMGVGAVWALTSAGAGEVVLVAAGIANVLVLVLGWTIAVTVLHEAHTGSVPAPRDRPIQAGVPVFRPSPSLVLALVVGLLGQVLVLTTHEAPAAAADAPGTYVVDSTEDSLAPGPGECVTVGVKCTLRGAVQQLSLAPVPGASITFDVSGTIDLQEPLLVGSSMAIDGTGQRVTLRNPDGGSMVFVSSASEGGGDGPIPNGNGEVGAAALTTEDLGAVEGVGEGTSSSERDGDAAVGTPSIAVLLRNLTFDGTAVRSDATQLPSSALIVGSGAAQVDSVTFIGNLNPDDVGSAISSSGDLHVVNSTFVDNAAGNDLGTIMTFGPATITNSTFFDNDGGGVVVGNGGTATIRNSLFKGEGGGFNCSTGAEVGGNLSNDPTCATESEPERMGLLAGQLGMAAIADNGGWVKTIALVPGSAAIGAADSASCPTTDARGVLRPIPPTPCDVGAYQSATGTTVTLAASQNPAPFGSPVTVTVTVEHPEGTPTGSVELSGLPGGATEQPIVSLGQATFAVEGLPVGMYPLTATYVPDGPLAASSSTLDLTIAKQISATMLTVTPGGGTSGVGVPLTLTATVRNGADASGPMPDGEVELFDGTTSLGTAPLVDGSATVTGVTLGGGSHSLTAAYTGSASFEASTSPAVVHAVQSAATVTVTAPATAVYGERLPLTATVPGAPAATGIVRFLATPTDGGGTLEIGFVTLTDGEGATTSYEAPIPIGDHDVVASYAGDDGHAASVSEPVRITVSAAATATALTGPSSSTVAGEPASFTATVSAAGSDIAPSGAVDFVVDTADPSKVTVPLVDGVATMTRQDLAVTGSQPHTITATYVPDVTGFLASSSDPVTHEVVRGSTSTVLSAPATSRAGEPVSLVAVVAPTAPSVADPIGRVTFWAGTTDLGTAPLIGGTATLSTTQLPVGTLALTASFGATPEMSGSTSNVVEHTVSRAITEVTLTSSVTSPTFGQTLTLTATAAAVAPGSGDPTGTVTFRDGTTTLGTATLASGVATLTLSTLVGGDHTLVASYDGDSRHTADEGALALTVAKVVPTVTITAVTPTPSSFGQPVTITASVISPAGTTPTGTVDFSFGGNGNVVGQAPVIAGVATLVISNLAPVRTTIEAHYLGDPGHVDAFSPSGSDDVLTFHTVTKAATYPVVVTTETTPTFFGERVRVLVDAARVGGRIPSGLVTIHIQNTDVTKATTFDADGHAQADLFPNLLGNITIVVTVAEDGWFSPQVVVYSGHRVSAGRATVTLEAPASSPTVGVPMLLLATVGPSEAAGHGSVHFYDGATELGSAAVGQNGLAGAWVTFTTRGTHTVTAVYDGAYGVFDPVTSAPISVPVLGRPLGFVSLPTAISYGSEALVTASLFSLDAEPPLPTGTITVKSGGTTLAQSPLAPASTSLGSLLIQTPVSLGRALAVGSHQITVSYSGDAVYSPMSIDTTIVVQKRILALSLEPPYPNPATAGEPLHLSARLTVPPGLPVAPTGTIELGNGVESCTVELRGGVPVGDCQVRLDGTLSSQMLRAVYSGDDRFAELTSAPVQVPVVKPSAVLDASTSGRWTDSEPVDVTWRTLGRGTAVPTGFVEVWTNEGRQSCPLATAGSCAIRFRAASEAGWIEVRYLGDKNFAPSARRESKAVLGCFAIAVRAPGTTSTQPNCAGTKFVAGTSVELTAEAPAGYTLAGWSYGPGTTPDHLLQSPIWPVRGGMIEPRFEPVCFTLWVVFYPRVARAAPNPAPNCDDRQGPNYELNDLAAIQTAEVEAGRMRYRVGTTVTLPDIGILANVAGGTVARLRWSGDEVGADGTVTMDGDRQVSADLRFPCSALVVDGPPGSSVSVVGSSLDTSNSSLYTDPTGGCQLADGGRGYLPGTQVTVAMAAGAGAWFDHWGPLEPLGTHRAPGPVPNVAERPAGARANGLTRIVVPPYDAAISGFASAVTCYELKLQVHDAVTPGQLADGTKAPTATASAPTCPAWWLTEHKVPTSTPSRWYLAGTEVTLTAGGETRQGYVDEFAAVKQISFYRWTGSISARTTTATVVMDGPRDVTAEWYVPAQCVPVTVHIEPSTAGEVVMSDVGDRCPQYPAQDGPLVRRAPLGYPVALAAKPHGTLQTIWRVEGTSVSDTEACRARESYIEEKQADDYEQGRSQAYTDRILMEQGYLPGLVVARIQEEAAWRFERGYTQAQIVDDLKTLGLLDADGAAKPDSLRANPCDSRLRDTVLPAGQRVISLNVDGSMVHTAYFCQAVKPSVTVVDLDGNRSPASGALLDSFGPVFRSSNTSGNCPTPGWFLPGTTAVLGSSGTGVPGYAIDGWTLDGAAAPAGPLSVPIAQDGDPHDVGLVVRVRCHKLTVNAEFGHTAYPLPNCPGVAASKGLYAQGTAVTVTAGQSTGHVFQGWGAAGSFNPVLAKMDGAVTLTASFRAKTIGETIMESVIDPALDAMGVAVKKTVGGVAYLTKVLAEHVIDDVFLKTLSSIGTGLAAGFGAIGVEGKVLDGIVLGLQTPSNAFGASLAGFDCVQEWAWGTSLPTLDDVKETLSSAATGAAKEEVQGVEVDDVIAQAQALTAKIAAGDPDALAGAYVAAAGGPAGAMVLALVLDMQANPDAWLGRAEALGDYGLTFLQEQFGKSFTWESSATEAWTSGGDAFLSCMAENGKDMAGQ